MPKPIEDLIDKKKEILKRVFEYNNFDYRNKKEILHSLDEYRTAKKGSITNEEKTLINHMLVNIHNIPDLVIEKKEPLKKEEVKRTPPKIIPKKEIVNEPIKTKSGLEKILIIGPEPLELCHFSENVFIGFEQLKKKVVYFSRQDFYDEYFDRYNKLHKEYPLSNAIQKLDFKPDLVIIDECNFLFKNDIQYIPVFYYHREMKRPPSVNHPDVIFLFHRIIQEYFENIMASNWMFNVPYHKTIPFGVNTEIYQPKDKIYRGVCGIGFRETMDYVRKVNEITMLPLAQIMFEEFEEFKSYGFTCFDTPISNEKYRELLPQCEAVFIHSAIQQYLSHKMFEAMACKTLCVVRLESDIHEAILREAGFKNGVHYIGIYTIKDIKRIYDAATNKSEIINNAYNKILRDHTYKKVAEYISKIYLEIAPELQKEIKIIRDPADLNIIVSSVERCGVSWFCYFISMIYERMYGKKKTWKERVSRLEAGNSNNLVPKGWNTVEYVPINNLTKKPYDKIILLQRKLEAVKEAMLYYYYNNHIYDIPDIQKPTLNYRRDKKNPEYQAWFKRIEEYYNQVYAETDNKNVLRIYIEDLNNYTVSTFNEILDFLGFKKEGRPFLIPVNTPERVWGAFSAIYKKGEQINERLIGIHKDFAKLNTSEIDNRKVSTGGDIVQSSELVICNSDNLTFEEIEIQKGDFTLSPFLNIPDALKIDSEIRFDVICPIYWINDSFFLDNIKSWIEEVPIKRLIFGVNQKDLDFEKRWLDKIKKISNNIDILIIDQTQYKTLGMCLSDLMKRVETDWFVYVHSDVKLMPESFSKMKLERNKKVGILESERIFFDGKKQTKGNAYRTERAYSGFQLIRKEAIKDIINEIEDDFIYRNEDFIFQSRCKANGFEYKKVLAYHIHQILETRRTFGDKETTFMQWKGLVKYTQPDDVNKESCVGSILKCIKDYGQVLSQILAFTWEFNPNWGEPIIEAYTKSISDTNRKR